MKVQELMMKSVASCRPDTNLASIAELLWRNACGSLPVLDQFGRVISMITDRDVCIAVGTRNRKASEIVVGDVSLPRVFSCTPDEEVEEALKTMGAQGVHRLPVTDIQGGLAGILSIDDIVRRAAAQPDTSQISYESAMKALQAIIEFRGREHRQLAVAHA